MSEREKLAAEMRAQIIEQSGGSYFPSIKNMLALIRAQERTHALVPVEASEGEIVRIHGAVNAGSAPDFKDGYATIRHIERARHFYIAYHRKTEGENE